MAIKNSLIFGGVSSADYGIFIGGEGVFDAPKRAVEMLEVPGRNGAIAIDLGRYENITVEYPVFVPARSKKEFRSKLSEFVNAIASQKGYQRLSDTYHPGEYRMGLFAEQIEVDPVRYNTAGGFRLIFNCKPQRYLTSGEQDISVSSGDTLINPTLFETGPLLEAEGYGTIAFNGYEIEIKDDDIGDVQLLSPITDRWTNSRAYYDGSLLEQGNTITVHGNRVVKFEARLTDSSYSVTGQSLIQTTANIPGTFSYTASQVNNEGYNFELIYEGDETFPYGDDVQINDFFTLQISCKRGGATTTVSRTVQISFAANSSYIRFIVPAGSSADGITFTSLGTYSFGAVTAFSTQSVLGNPTYIDCDFGEAYKIDGGEVISLNAYIDLGSDLPKLASGANEITYDNTITQLKVVPKWWKV